MGEERHTESDTGTSNSLCTSKHEPVDHDAGARVYFEEDRELVVDVGDVGLVVTAHGGLLHGDVLARPRDEVDARDTGVGAHYTTSAESDHPSALGIRETTEGCHPVHIPREGSSSWTLNIRPSTF